MKRRDIMERERRRREREKKKHQSRRRKGEKARKPTAGPRFKIRMKFAGGHVYMS